MQISNMCIHITISYKMSAAISIFIMADLNDDDDEYLRIYFFNIELMHLWRALGNYHKHHIIDEHGQITCGVLFIFERARINKKMAWSLIQISLRKCTQAHKLSRMYIIHICVALNSIVNAIGAYDEPQWESICGNCNSQPHHLLYIKFNVYKFKLHKFCACSFYLYARAALAVADAFFILFSSLASVHNYLRL